MISIRYCLLLVALWEFASAAPKPETIAQLEAPTNNLFGSRNGGNAAGTTQAVVAQPAISPPATALPHPSPSTTPPPPPPAPQPSSAPPAIAQQPAVQPQPQPPVAVNPVISILNSGSPNDTLSPVVEQSASSFNETTQPPPKNFTFEEMLGPDFLHFMNISTMPEPEAFRKAFGAPSNASGKFHGCKNHAECFQFREPAEWCRPKNNVQWKGKSCFCTKDTMTPSCIVERTDGDKTEWTFCSSFLDLNCT